MDLEQGIKLTSFTDNEPPKMILDKKNESDLNGAKILVVHGMLLIRLQR